MLFSNRKDISGKYSFDNFTKIVKLHVLSLLPPRLDLSYTQPLSSVCIIFSTSDKVHWFWM